MHTYANQSENTEFPVVTIIKSCISNVDKSTVLHQMHCLTKQNIKTIYIKIIHTHFITYEREIGYNKVIFKRQKQQK